MLIYKGMPVFLSLDYPRILRLTPLRGPCFAPRGCESPTLPLPSAENRRQLVSDEAKGSLAISLAGLLWGFNYVNAKFAISEIDPFALTLLRMVVATPLFFVVLTVARRPARGALRDWKTFLPLGLTGVAASQLLWIYGLQHTTPAHSALMFTLLPVFTAVLAIFLLGEKVSPLQGVGIGTAFAGAALLATEGGISLEQGYLAGDLLTLGAVFTFSLYTVLSKPVVAAYGTRRTLALTYLYSLPFVVPFTLLPMLEQDWGAGRVTALGWAAVLYLIVFATVGTSQLHQYSLKHLPSTKVAIFFNLQPLFAAIFSVALGFERLSWGFLIASALIFAGLVVFRLKKR